MIGMYVLYFMHNFLFHAHLIFPLRYVLRTEASMYKGMGITMANKLSLYILN